MTAEDRAVLLRAVAERREVRLEVGNWLVFGTPVDVRPRTVRLRERGGRVEDFSPASVLGVRLLGAP